MLQRYNEYADSFSKIIHPEREQPTAPSEWANPSRYEIVLDNDATEQEVEEFLHGKSDEDDMQ